MGKRIDSRKKNGTLVKNKTVKKIVEINEEKFKNLKKKN